MIAKSEEEHCYHDKLQEPELYAVVLEIWQCFAMDEMLKQSHHLFWCQKSKLLNQIVAVFAPKDKHLSGNMSLANCVTLVIIINSIGYTQGICKVMEEVGCSLPASTIECLMQHNAEWEYGKVYHSSIECRWWHGAKQWEIIESLWHQNRDKKDGFKYEPSIAIREDVEENSHNHKSEMTNAAPNSIAIGTKKSQKKAPVVFPLKECSLKGHKMTISK